MKDIAMFYLNGEKVLNQKTFKHFFFIHAEFKRGIHGLQLNSAHRNILIMIFIVIERFGNEIFVNII